MSAIFSTTATIDLEPEWVFKRRNDLGGLRIFEFVTLQKVSLSLTAAPSDEDVRAIVEDNAVNVNLIFPCQKTVNGRLKAFYARDDLIKAEHFMHRLVYESSKSIASQICTGSMLNGLCSTKNVYDSVHICMGELEAGTKGKRHKKQDKNPFKKSPIIMFRKK